MKIGLQRREPANSADNHCRFDVKKEIPAKPCQCKAEAAK
jgi:hypothetical protein